MACYSHPIYKLQWNHHEKEQKSRPVWVPNHTNRQIHMISFSRKAQVGQKDTVAPLELGSHVQQMHKSPHSEGLSPSKGIHNLEWTFFGGGAKKCAPLVYNALSHY